MNTDEQRMIAKYVAIYRENGHVNAGDLDDVINQRISGKQTKYLGLLGEFACYNDFGTLVDLGFTRGRNDRFSTYAGRIPLSIKTNGVDRTPLYLRVRMDKFMPEAIYIAGEYDRAGDEVNLVGWEWGAVLMSEDNTIRWGDGPRNYIKRHSDLRPLAELKTVLMK